MIDYGVVGDLFCVYNLCVSCHDSCLLIKKDGAEFFIKRKKGETGYINERKQTTGCLTEVG